MKSNQILLKKKDYYDFPENLISKDITKEHREIIFNANTSMESPQEKNIGDSFYFSSDKQHYAPNQFANSKNPRFKFNQRGNLMMSNTNIQDTKKFGNNLTMTNESIQYEGAGVNKNNQKLLESMINDKEPTVEANKTKIEDYFQNNDERIREDQSQSNIFSEQIKNSIDGIAVQGIDLSSNYNFRGKSQNQFVPVNIKLIYSINGKLNYPKDDPLWYIFHSVARSSFGPISSVHLEEIYNSKNIDGQSDVRLIDIFKVKNKGNFSYFKLKEIENPHLLRDIIEGSSNLIKYIELLNKIKIEEEIKLNTATVKIEANISRTPLISNPNIFEMEPKQNIQPKEKPNTKKTQKKKFIDLDPLTAKNQDFEIDIKTNDQTNQKKEEKLEVVFSSQEPSIIDEEKEKADSFQLKKEEPKKKWKKKKGKLQDFDVKTGFYTLSHQDKNYNPIFICGESEQTENIPKNFE